MIIKTQQYTKYIKFVLYVLVIVLVNLAGLTLFYRADLTKSGILCPISANRQWRPFRNR